MKKFVLLFLLSVATMANAQINLGSDLGLFAGAGLAYQRGKVANNSSFEQPGFVTELGAVYKKCVEADVNLSISGNTMLSLDINGRTYLARQFDLLYGAGYGFIFYDDITSGVIASEGVVSEVKQSGSIDWPHANVGVIYAIDDNMDLRVVGVIGYAEGLRFVGEEKNWHFISQIRASVVWNF